MLVAAHRQVFYEMALSTLLCAFSALPDLCHVAVRMYSSVDAGAHILGVSQYVVLHWLSCRIIFIALMLRYIQYPVTWARNHQIITSSRQLVQSKLVRVPFPQPGLSHSRKSPRYAPAITRPPHSDK